jgi:hypothetical protein
VVTAIEVTERNTQDVPYFAPLITKTTDQFNVLRVMGDKAYRSYANLELTVSKGTEPFIPFKSYAKATSPSETWNRLFGYFIMHREEFLKAYHKRSNAESTFSAIKRVFGDSVRSKTHVAQVNEVLLKMLAHNIRCLIHATSSIRLLLIRHGGYWAEGSAVSTLSHPFSDAFRLGSRCASITNSADRPSQCCGSPYFPLIGFLCGRLLNSAIGAALLRPLHLQHAVARFSSALEPPIECAST